MRSITLILLCCCFGICWSQQSYVVLFEKKTINNVNKQRYAIRNIISPEEVTDHPFLKGIPVFAPSYKVYSVTINPGQEVYNRYLNKEIEKEKFYEYISTYGVDTTQYTKNTGIRNEFYIYHGVDEKSDKKYIIVDTNDDLDFSGEQIYEFPLHNPDTSAIKKVSLTDIDIHITGGDDIKVSIDPYNTRNARVGEYRPDFVINTCDFLQGTVAIDNNLIYVTVSGDDNLAPTKANEGDLFNFNYDNKMLNMMRRIGDTIALADRKIHIQKIEDNKLYLEDLEIAKDSGSVGSIHPVMYASSLDGQPVNLNPSLKDKYVFIDFWGSWCGPCIEAIPELRVLYEKINGRGDILMLGIALEYVDNVSKLKKVIADRGVQWQNFWTNYKDQTVYSSIQNKFHVEQYPTYVILDKEGRIIYKGSKTQDAIDFFLKIIGE